MEPDCRMERVEPKRKPAGRYHHGDLRRALLDAALVLLDEGGVASLTLRGAARRAGVTQAAPYRHFADKEALLAAVAEEGFRALADRMQAVAGGADDAPLRRLRGLGLAYVAFATEHPARYRVMFGAEIPDKAAHPDLKVAADRAFGLLRDSIEACQQVGAVRSDDVNRLAMIAWSLVHGLAALLIDGQLASVGVEGGEAQELAEVATTTIFDGFVRRTS